MVTEHEQNQKSSSVASLGPVGNAGLHDQLPARVEHSLHRAEAPIVVLHVGQQPFAEGVELAQLVGRVGSRFEREDFFEVPYLPMIAGLASAL